MQYINYRENRRRGTADFPLEYYHVTASHPQYVMSFHWHVEFELNPHPKWISDCYHWWNWISCRSRRQYFHPSRFDPFRYSRWLRIRMSGVRYEYADEQDGFLLSFSSPDHRSWGFRSDALSENLQYDPPHTLDTFWCGSLQKRGVSACSFRRHVSVFRHSLQWRFL